MGNICIQLDALASNRSESFWLWLVDSVGYVQSQRSHCVYRKAPSEDCLEGFNKVTQSLQGEIFAFECIQPLLGNTYAPKISIHQIGT